MQSTFVALALLAGAQAASNATHGNTTVSNTTAGNSTHNGTTHSNGTHNGAGVAKVGAVAGVVGIAALFL